MKKAQVRLSHGFVAHENVFPEDLRYSVSDYVLIIEEPNGISHEFDEHALTVSVAIEDELFPAYSNYTVNWTFNILIPDEMDSEDITVELGDESVHVLFAEEETDFNFTTEDAHVVYVSSGDMISLTPFQFKSMYL